MKFKKIIFCILIVNMVLAFEDSSRSPIGNWEMFDMEGITGLGQLVNVVPQVGVGILVSENMETSK